MLSNLNEKDAFILCSGVIIALTIIISFIKKRYKFLHKISPLIVSFSFEVILQSPWALSRSKNTCLYYYCETSVNPFQVSRVMLNHRKDPSLFTKMPLFPYLGSGEQEFPLLISVQNLPHTWDMDLA